MLAGWNLAAAAIAAYPSFAGDRVAITPMVIITAGIVIMTGVIVIARVGSVNDGELLLIFPVLMKLTRAKRVQVAPENGVQQYRRNGQKVARDTHA